MKTVAYYECEFCGERFNDECECLWHEKFHNLEDLFTSGAKFYDKDGRLLAIDNFKDIEDFAGQVYGIDCPSVAMANIIQEIFCETGDTTPFEEIETSTAPCRIMYNPETYGWFNADEEIARIKRQFGEK